MLPSKPVEQILTAAGPGYRATFNFRMAGVICQPPFSGVLRRIVCDKVRIHIRGESNSGRFAFAVRWSCPVLIRTVLSFGKLALGLGIAGAKEPTGSHTQDGFDLRVSACGDEGDTADNDNGSHNLVGSPVHVSSLYQG